MPARPRHRRLQQRHAINDAGAGHSAIRAYKDGFRVIASTPTVNARDNAALTGTGERIYWLDGAHEGRGQLLRPVRRVVG